MKNLLSRVGSVSVAFVVVAAASGPALADSAAEASWAKMTRCASISDDNARHTCTDDTLREAGLLESKAVAARKSFGLQTPPPTATASAPPAAPATKAPTTAPTAGGAAVAAPASSKKPQKEKEQVEVTLAKVEHSGDGKLMMTTSDGAVWHQVESGAIRQLPKQGDTMTIEARSLGGFMCEPSKYVAFRCYRSK